MTLHDTGQHRLQVENFGPIAKADIELRPLTVFVGPSNAGKSYLAKLIYALHGYFSRPMAFTRRRLRSTSFHEQVRGTNDLDRVIDWLEGYLDGDTVDEESACPDEVANLARAAVQSPEVGSLLTHELFRVFGAHTLRDLILNSNSRGKMTLSHAVSSPGSRTAPFRYFFRMSAGRKELTCDLDVPEDAPIRLERSGSYWSRGIAPGFFHLPRRRSPDGSPIPFMRLQVVLADLAQPCTVGAISRPAYYLPASRSGVVEAFGALVGSALDRMTRAGRRQSEGSLSGVLVDFIKQTFVDLRSTASGWDGGEALARQVERTILQGAVRVDELEHGASSVAYRPDGWEEDLPLARASSVVTEIVPIVLYLRHYVTPGSTIIIEEPEAHMHPAMQVRFAAAIARIVEAGVRVIITAHSGWLLSALANIVRLAKLPGHRRGDIAGGDIMLPASDVGAWLFVPRDGGTVTEELLLDSDDGMYEAGYPEVAKALYYDWADISSRLQED